MPLPWLLVASGVPWLVDNVLRGSSHCLPAVQVFLLSKFPLFVRTPVIQD